MSRPPAPLPPLSPRTLLRALFQRPASAAGTTLASRYKLNGIDLAHLARYRAAFGFSRASIPLPYLYLLAQRAHLATALDHPVPFRIPGMVHVANRLVAHASFPPATCMVLETVLRMAPPGASGALYCDLETRFHAGSALLVECASRYLVRRARPAGRAVMPATLPPAVEAIGSWQLQADAGRRYAALSGDWNPIHLAPLTARLLGIRQPIIHGAHTLAMAARHLEQYGGKELSMLACRFRAPIPLGASVQVGVLDGGAFAVHCGGTLAVEGEYAGRERVRQQA